MVFIWLESGDLPVCFDIEFLKRLEDMIQGGFVSSWGTGISETRFGSSRPRLKMSESQ